MKLRTAFGITRGDVVALVGAGGKTTTLMALGHELTAEGWRVLATTTTRFHSDEFALLPAALRPADGPRRISAALSAHGLVGIYTEIRAGRVAGVAPEQIGWVLDSVDADVLLVEADQADGLPWKGPRAGEPNIPPQSTLVIPTVSLQVLGQPLDETHVYNPASLIERYGFYAGKPVISAWLAQTLRDDQMGLRGIPRQARVIGWLNAAPVHGTGRGWAQLIARLALRSPRLRGVAIGSARSRDPVYEVRRPVAAVVLAAGLSTRMGEPKVLLPWINQKPIIEHIIEQLILARVDQVVVVTGHRATEVAEIAARWGVNVAHNPNYATGEMLSSLKTGLHALPAQMGAALLVLGDQPRIQPQVIGQVIAAYTEGEGSIVAPSYQMQRGHPILIDRRYWPEIMALPKDSAPREVINRHAGEIAYVTVDTDSVLRDVDTPQDYQDERWRAGLT
ncbi:MAG: putative selenium-dependent hydroxylase accessory protein YqeC [Chloroflexi bacterium]|nr:putative selenium-dependent hydroxylase accessory protein YqeC [Chloroflexota bacterium]